MLMLWFLGWCWSFCWNSTLSCRYLYQTVWSTGGIPASLYREERWRDCVLQTSEIIWPVSSGEDWLRWLCCDSSYWHWLCWGHQHQSHSSTQDSWRGLDPDRGSKVCLNIIVLKLSHTYILFIVAAGYPTQVTLRSILHNQESDSLTPASSALTASLSRSTPGMTPTVSAPSSPSSNPPVHSTTSLRRRRSSECGARCWTRELSSFIPESSPLDSLSSWLLLLSMTCAGLLGVLNKPTQLILSRRWPSL